MKKAVGWIRKGDVAEEERQRRAIEGYCLKENLEIVEWLSEGYEDFGKVAYGNWIGHRRIDAVVAADPHTVTKNVFEFYAYRCKLEMRGSGLRVTEWKDYPGYSIYKNAFEEFTKVLTQKELEYEPVRNPMGKVRKARQGGYIGGQAPMGYRVKDGKLVVNPEEVPVVKFILKEKHAGRTKIGTVEKLNAGGYKTRKGKPFVISTVQSIWNNEQFYYGYSRYGKDGEWVKGQHEAIMKK